MKIAKAILTKAENSALNPYEALLDQHTTPTVDMTTSPAQRFLHRRLKSEIPKEASLLTPDIAETILEEKAKKTAKSEMYHNRTAKDLSVKPGDTVTIKPEGVTKGHKWRKGLVVQKHPYRSYDVEVDRKTLQKNRVHLKPIGKATNPEKTQSAQKPNAYVKVSAPDTKTSSSNPVPKATKIQSESTRPAKSATKMELVVAKWTHSGHLVKVRV